VFDDENVPGLKAEAALAQGLQKFFGEGIARADFVREGNRDQMENGRKWRGFLAPLRG
jgi:hypothetical protein